MIKILREQEEVMLYANVFDISPEEQNKVVSFLNSEFERESLNYPGKAPSFNPTAAFWAAKICYFAAQLILYRKDEPSSLEILFESYEEALDHSAHLSADLCLRFLPKMIFQLKAIDPEDLIIEHLEAILRKFPLSGVECLEEMDESEIEDLLEEDCYSGLL
ncbi:MAG: hypothetical protein MRY83_05650, partial [Flavobacteriales bacterium]|nr:hypothetical protein [Flavobacteriales bacterium]